jgi:hypothetical protein
MFLALEAARPQLPHIARSLVPLPASVAVLIGLGAAVIVLWEEAWGLAEHLNVVAHEGAHALVGFGAGRKVTAISMKLDKDAGLTGGTLSAGKKKGFGVLLSTFVGYLGPSGFGLGAAKLIAMGHIQAVLWLAIVGLALVLLLARSARALVTVILVGGPLFLILSHGAAGLQTASAYAITWLLLVSGVRAVLGHGTKAGDAAVLKGLTHLPKLVWFGAWLAGTLAALAAGGHMLV